MSECISRLIVTSIGLQNLVDFSLLFMNAFFEPLVQFNKAWDEMNI